MVEILLFFYCGRRSKMMIVDCLSHTGCKQKSIAFKNIFIRNNVELLLK